MEAGGSLQGGPPAPTCQHPCPPAAKQEEVLQPSQYTGGGLESVAQQLGAVAGPLQEQAVLGGQVAPAGPEQDPALAAPPPGAALPAPQQETAGGPGILSDGAGPEQLRATSPLEPQQPEGSRGAGSGGAGHTAARGEVEAGANPEPKVGGEGWVLDR